jgi:hypothetical protein
VLRSVAPGQFLLESFPNVISFGGLNSRFPNLRYYVRIFLANGRFGIILYFRNSIKIICVIIFIQVQLFGECPIHKLNEQNLTFAVLISLFPLLVHVGCIDSPLLQKRSCRQKLIFINTLVLTVVNFVESNEEFIVLAQKLEQKSELFAFCYVIVTVGCFLG